MKGYMYILLFANGQYYTGSTINLEYRVSQHQRGEGANFTRKHRPITLVYFEEYDRIQKAFQREKQIQCWSHKRKEALIKRQYGELKHLSRNNSEFAVAGRLDGLGKLD